MFHMTPPRNRSILVANVGCQMWHFHGTITLSYCKRAAGASDIIAEAQTSPLVVSRMSSGGCSFPSQSCSSTPPHLPSLNLSIKSERSSPERMSSPASPPLHHLRQHSPMSNPDSTRHTPPEPCTANETKELPKAGYLQDEEEGGQPLRQLVISDGWQR